MNATSRLHAILGPTNTGKTHFAVERMLGHENGVIGLPLRLLAREIYDRLRARLGSGAVALLTGEEKILPERARYFVCTTESMPKGRRFAFLAVDEIQLAADPERGHVFTERLLHARGTAETLFLGADTARPFLRRLLPDIEIDGRARFSALSHAGHKKISRLPKRSAVVAFSANDVYAIAELIRRQRGGAAVVMGALSPRTRNAQVALFQSGEVDYLVATDAIGMGLNMDVDHVALAGLHKFDGARMRAITTAEIGQIAGRAGRHMNDGSFGTTAKARPLDEDVALAVENHSFQPIGAVCWRNRDLRFSSVGALIASLEAPPPEAGLIRPRDAMDLLSLKALAAQEDLRGRLGTPADVRLLWEVCQIPDFRKTMREQHVQLLHQIFIRLQDHGGWLTDDWIGPQIARLERFDGDIDTLAVRLAHIRTWTFISHREGWLHDARHWQERAREAEDRLSDALHERLTQRFIDRKGSVLIRRLKDRQAPAPAVMRSGEVLIGGESVGRLKGLTFAATTDRTENKAVRAAIDKIMTNALDAAGQDLANATDEQISLDADAAALIYNGETIADLVPGPTVLTPGVHLRADGRLPHETAGKIAERLNAWLKAHLEEKLKPLYRLPELSFTAPARGIAFQLSEALGVLARRQVADLARDLDAKDFGRFKYNGVTLGRIDIFLPVLLKPEATALRCMLWRVFNGKGAEYRVEIPNGRVSVPAPEKKLFTAYLVAGYRVRGPLAIRVDMLDRLVWSVGKAARDGAFDPLPEWMNLVGCKRDEFTEIMRALGYREIRVTVPAAEAVKAGHPLPQPDEGAEATEAEERSAPEEAEAAAAESPAETEDKAADAAPVGAEAGENGQAAAATTTTTAAEGMTIDPDMMVEVVRFERIPASERRREHKSRTAKQGKGPRQQRRGGDGGKPRQPAGKGRKPATVDPDSPFAALQKLLK